MNGPVDLVARAFVTIALQLLAAGAVATLFAWLVIRFGRLRDAGTRAAVWALAIAVGLVAPFLGGRGDQGVDTSASRGTSFEDEVVLVTSDGPADDTERSVRYVASESIGGTVGAGDWTLPGGTWPRAAFFVWLVVAGFGVARFVADVRRLWRDQRASRPAGRRIASRVRSLAVRSGVSRPVSVGLVEGLGSPRLIGGRRPTILLPESLADWDDRALDPILLHELAHAARYDDLQCALIALVEALLPFHVPLWIAARRLDEERELACDDRAARILGGGMPLARALTAAAWPGAARLAPAPYAAPTPSRLARRVRRLARADVVVRPPASVRALSVALFLVGGIALTAPLPGVRVASATDVDEDRPSSAVRYALEDPGVRTTVRGDWSGLLPHHASGDLVLEDGFGADRWRLEVRAAPGEGFDRRVFHGDASVPFDTEQRRRLERALTRIRQDVGGAPAGDSLLAIIAAWGLRADESPVR